MAKMNFSNKPKPKCGKCGVGYAVIFDDDYGGMCLFCSREERIKIEREKIEAKRDGK